MKNKLLIIVAAIVVILVGAGAIFMLGDSGEGDLKTADVKKVIVGKDWFYSGEGDGNHIYFGENGEYAYWCDSGDGVDGHDIYEEYEFTGSSGEIEVKGSGKSEIIKIISYSDTELKLLIGDKTVEFMFQED